MNTLVTKLSPSEISIFPEYDNHAEVYRFENSAVGLRGYISIHRKRGKLSTGGTRFFPFQSDADALRDGLRLSAAMTAKCVVSGLPYGGAKGVIIGDPKVIKTEALLLAYAEVVESLDGAFRTGEDVGMTEGDVQIMMTQSRFFNGKSDVAGDPSPYASLSVYVTMKEAARLHMQKENLDGCAVSIKGLGKVGEGLVDLLSREDTRMVGADIDPAREAHILTLDPSFSFLPVEEVAYAPCDIFAPCAMGKEVRFDNLSRFQSKIICGGANNQLETPSLAAAIADRGVLYVPDYLANAGGVINVSDELEEDGYHKERVISRINNLVMVLRDCYTDAQLRKITLAESVSDFVQTHI